MNNIHRVMIIIPLLIVLVLTACTAEVGDSITPTPLPDATVSAQNSSNPPTPTLTDKPTNTPPLPTNTPTLTFVPGPDLPVLAGTPVPLPNEPITPENVDQIQELAIWGKGRIEQIIYSPNGEFIAIGTSSGVWLYDTKTLTELSFINTGNFVGGLTFRADSRELMIDTGASTLSTWDVQTGVLLESNQIRDGYYGRINSSPGSVVLFSDATVLAATLDDRRIGVWADQGETYLYTLEGHKDTIQNLALSYDYKLLASGSLDGTILLWDVKTGERLYTLDVEYRYGIAGLAFAPEVIEGNEIKTLLATSGGSNPPKLWNANTGELLNTLDEYELSTKVLSFSPNGNLLVLGVTIDFNNSAIHIWDITNNTLLYVLNGYKGRIQSVAFSPDSKTLISGSVVGTVQRWDMETGALVDNLTGFNPPEGISRFPSRPLSVFLSDEKMYISNPSTNQIELWDLKNALIEQSLTGHESSVTNLALAETGNTLISSHIWSKNIWVWDTLTGQNRKTFEDFYIDVGYKKTLAISPDGTMMAQGDERGGAGVVHSIESEQGLYHLPGEQRSVNIDFSLDGKQVAAASGRIVTLSKAESGELLHTIQTNGLDGGLKFSPDSHTITIGNQGMIQLRNTSTGELEKTLDTGQNKILGLAYSPDGQILAAGLKDPQIPYGSLNPTIWLWDVKTGELLHTIKGYQGNISHIAFSPTGTLLSTSSLDGTMRLWGVLSD